MIILRQKQYATGVERTMVALNKVPKQSIKDKAGEISKQKTKDAIKKIEQTLGKEGLEKKSIGGFFRGKGVRSRVKMGQVSPEAVEHLKKKKILEVLNDKSISPEEIEKKLREPSKEKVKKTASTVAKKIKGGAKSLYEDTSGVAGKAVKLGVEHPGIFIGNVATTAGPLALPAGACAAVQGATAATHAGTGGGVAGEWFIKDIPVRRAVRDPKTGKRVRDSVGKVVRRKPVPLNKILSRWGRKAGKHVEEVFEGKPLKGSIKRVANTVRESHRASHPYENIVSTP